MTNDDIVNLTAMLVALNGRLPKEMTDSLERVIFAAKKQIPKTKKHDCCPECGTNQEFLVNWLANPRGHKIIYCWNCGQAIDWSDYE